MNTKPRITARELDLVHIGLNALIANAPKYCAEWRATRGTRARDMAQASATAGVGTTSRRDHQKGATE